MLPFSVNFRGISFVSIIGIGIGIFVILNNTKEKPEYDKSSGTIEYLEKEFQNLPTRHKGDYRYLKIDSYPYLFEIFLPNSEPTKKTLDHLKAGDPIEIYYYETADTGGSGINRYTQFIDFNGQPYFIRSGFQEQFGYFLIGLFVLFIFIGYVLWRKEKLEW